MMTQPYVGNRDVASSYYAFFAWSAQIDPSMSYNTWMKVQYSIVLLLLPFITESVHIQSSLAPESKTDKDNTDP